MVELQRPCYAVVDTGTTGLVISDSLYDSDELPLPGAAIREVGVEVLTERGRTTNFTASRAVQRERGDDLPLICTAQQLPWFDGRPRPLGGVGAACDESGCGREGTTRREYPSETPHVLFLGLAFLDRAQLTIDVDDRRMALRPPV